MSSTENKTALTKELNELNRQREQFDVAHRSRSYKRR